MILVKLGNSIIILINFNFIIWLLAFTLDSADSAWQYGRWGRGCV